MQTFYCIVQTGVWQRAKFLAGAGKVAVAAGQEVFLTTPAIVDPKLSAVRVTCDALDLIQTEWGYELKTHAAILDDPSARQQ